MSIKLPASADIALDLAKSAANLAILADKYKQADNQLKRLTDSELEFIRLREKLDDISSKNGKSYIETVNEFVKISTSSGRRVQEILTEIDKKQNPTGLGRGLSGNIDSIGNSVERASVGLFNKVIPKAAVDFVNKVSGGIAAGADEVADRLNESNLEGLERTRAEVAARYLQTTGNAYSGQNTPRKIIEDKMGGIDVTYEDPQSQSTRTLEAQLTKLDRQIRAEQARLAEQKNPSILVGAAAETVSKTQGNVITPPSGDGTYGAGASPVAADPNPLLGEIDSIYELQFTKTQQATRAETRDFIDTRQQLQAGGVDGEGGEGAFASEEEKRETLELLEQQHQDRMKALVAKNIQDQKDAEEKTYKQRIGVAKDFTGNMSTLMQSSSKRQFEIGKKFALANAIISGYDAIQGAFAAGNKIHPAVGVAFAASAAVAAKINIDAIRNQQFGGGGNVSAGSAAAGDASAPAVPPSSQAGGLNDRPMGGNMLQVHINGAMNEEFVREHLIPAIAAEVEHNDIEILSINSRNVQNIVSEAQRSAA